MNGDAPISRFLVRQDARGCWMVWDREARCPAQVAGAPSTGLSKEQAQELLKRLEEASSLDVYRSIAPRNDPSGPNLA